MTWCNYVIIICMIIALHAMQLLHERNTQRATFASRCRALNSEISWNRCKLHFRITSSVSDRFTLFLQLWNALDEFYNFMSLNHYNMCENIAVVNALHERNTLRTTFASRCRALESENNWNMKILFHNIFCIWHRYNVIFAIMKCVWRAL